MFRDPRGRTALLAVAGLLLAGCSPALYQRQTVKVDHRELDQFEIRYASFEGCLLRQDVPVSYRVRRPLYTMELAVHFGTGTEPATLDILLSGAEDLSARFPGLAATPAAEARDGGVRYRVSAGMEDSGLAVQVLRGTGVAGDEYLKLEPSTCQAMSLGG